MVDIHADRPTADHPVYCMAKAANAMMVKALAHDLAPDVRVNGVAPGAALWPAGYMADEERKAILERIPLGRPAGADQIARCGDVYGNGHRLCDRANPGRRRRAQRTAVKSSANLRT